MSSKSNVEVDALLKISWDQPLESETIQDIFFVVISGPKACMEVCTCSIKGCKILQVDHSSENLSLQDWVKAQEMDKVICQVVILYRKKELDITKH